MKFYDLKALDRKGKEIKFKEYKGKVLLIVNTATGCGFTPQYKELEEMYRRYQDQGFEILDFPCDQFGHQAPGSDDEINEFCTMRYETTFPRFKKIEVNGDNESEVFTYLKKEMPSEEVKGMKNKMVMKAISKISTTCKNDGDIKWNFTKFLVDREGNVVSRFAPTTIGKEIEDKVVDLLG